jgi:formylmethanofuran dehydrogenase subunit E
MLSLDEYLREAEITHGHLCAGQVLGVRLAMLGLKTLGIDDPRNNKEDRKRLVTFVEIDRCATDAIAVVTGCRLGKRALKFRDWGKMAATFVDLSRSCRDGTTSGTVPDAPLKPASRLSASASDHSYKAIRIAAKESSKALARSLHPELESKNQQQMLAYREISEDDLFTQRWVKVDLPPEEFPGYKSDRIVCANCGEGINFHREVVRNERVLCRACAGERYYELL